MKRAARYVEELHCLCACTRSDLRQAAKRVYPPPTPIETATAGFLAGSIQSLFAAPLDAIQVRYEHYDPVSSTNNKTRTPQSMWSFGREKLREIGARGVFAGYTLSLLKDSFGSAIFFSTFEYVKAQGYYNFIRWYYGALGADAVETLAQKRPHKSHHTSSHNSSQSRAGNGDGFSTEAQTVTPHYAIEPAFLFLAGISASIAQSSIIYPLHHVQTEHLLHLEELDTHATKFRHGPRLHGHERFRMMRVYYKAYQETLQQCKDAARQEIGGSLRKWLYRGFTWNTLRQLPSTSAGLIIFELVRRKYGQAADEVRISSKGGHYDILVA